MPPAILQDADISSKQDHASLSVPISVWHDWEVHHPLGAGSYVFQSALTSSILRMLHISEDFNVPAKPVVIHCGYQPNSSPHIGTMTVLALAFQLARNLKETRSNNLDVMVQVDVVDTAPDGSEEFKVGKGLQRSLRYTGAVGSFRSDFVALLDLFSQLSSVKYKETVQAGLCQDGNTSKVIRAIIQDRQRLGPELSPCTGKLALRAGCPECGIADKHGIHNVYDDDKGTIEFHCPKHGSHTVDLHNEMDVARLEFNTPLRNLVRALVFASDDSAVHLRVTGSDYAGQYQEQLLLRQWPFLAQYDGNVERVKRTPIHIYAPLTVDWAGSKLSKSLYVASNAYTYLRNQNLDYLLSVSKMKELGKDPKVIWHEVGSWVEEPKKLFRSYSIEYWHMVFTQAEMLRH